MPKREISNTTILLAMTIMLLFFYVYQRIQIFRLGYRIRSAEKKSLEIEKENLFLSLKISGLVSPERIQEEIKRKGLDLVPPREGQIVRIKEDDKQGI